MSFQFHNGEGKNVKVGLSPVLMVVSFHYEMNLLKDIDSTYLQNYVHKPGHGSSYKPKSCMKKNALESVEAQTPQPIQLRLPWDLRVRQPKKKKKKEDGGLSE